MHPNAQTERRYGDERKARRSAQRVGSYGAVSKKTQYPVHADSGARREQELVHLSLTPGDAHVQLGLQRTGPDRALTPAFGSDTASPTFATSAPKTVAPPYVHTARVRARVRLMWDDTGRAFRLSRLFFTPFVQFPRSALSISAVPLKARVVYARDMSYLHALGAALGLATVLGLRVSLRRRLTAASATGLVAAALVYPFASLVQGYDVPLHGAAAAPYVAIGAFARNSPLVLAVGWALHSVADAVAVHRPLVVPEWYPPVCVGFDLVFGVALGVLGSEKGRRHTATR